LVGPEYYAALGRNAYARLSAQSSGAALASLFEELAGRFPEFVRVLTEISAQELFRREQDTLRLYKRWLHTRGRREADLLVRRGIMPFAPPSQRRHYARPRGSRCRKPRSATPHRCGAAEGGASMGRRTGRSLPDPCPAAPNRSADGAPAPVHGRLGSRSYASAASERRAGGRGAQRAAGTALALRATTMVKSERGDVFHCRSTCSVQ